MLVSKIRIHFEFSNQHKQKQKNQIDGKSNAMTDTHDMSMID